MAAPVALPLRIRRPALPLSAQRFARPAGDEVRAVALVDGSVVRTVPVLSERQPPARLATGRWSASAWAFMRRGEARSLASGGALGGSQIGARFGYRINSDPERPLGLSLRLYSPMSRTRAAEAALGLEWTPVSGLPVRLLAERRQAIGREGRSAFSLLAHGGVSDLKAIGPLRISAYAQMGAVGIRSRDMFGDGAAMALLPLDHSGRIKVGGGAWAAAQPGVSRVDVGPSLKLHLPVEGHGMTLSADWRIRVAGDAGPGSGPAVTLTTGF